MKESDYDKLLRTYHENYMKYSFNKHIEQYTLNKQKEKENWLKSLTKEEKKDIIQYELTWNRCNNISDIEPVLEIFEGIYEDNLIKEAFKELEEILKGVI